MKKIYNILFVLTSLLFLIAINKTAMAQETVQASSYYFPIKSFFEPKVYVYFHYPDSTYGYWHMQTTVSNKDTLFTTKLYDDDFFLSEISTEKITIDGAYMVDYKLIRKFDDNTIVEAQCDILENEIYSYDISTESCVFETKTNSSLEFEQIHNKKRYLMGTITTNFVLNDNSIPCLEFMDFATDTFVDDNDIYLTSRMRIETHLYGKGIGRMQTVVERVGEPNTLRKLVQIISKEEFNEMKQNNH